MRILLVDDELPIRDYLKTLVDWAGYGYEFLEADNGFAAIKMMEKNQISLILLDVTMPGMTGLEVLEWIKEKEYSCIVSILTSHDEFYYAQKALRLGCFDYILKSEITGERILALAERMQQQVSEEYKQEQHYATLEIAARRKEALEIQNSINYWLNSRELPDFDITQFFYNRLKFQKEEQYLLLDIAIKNYDNVIQRYTGSDIVQFSYILDNILCELLEKHHFSYTEVKKGEFLLFLRFEKNLLLHNILLKVGELTEQIESQFQNLLGIESSMVYSLPFKELLSSKVIYETMSLVHPYQFFMGAKGIFCLDDYIFDKEICKGKLNGFEEELYEAMTTRSMLRVDLCYHAFMKEIVDNHYCINITEIIRLCERCITRFLISLSVLPVDCHSLRERKDMESLIEVMATILRPYCISNENQDKNMLIKKAFLLIQQQYGNDIGLEWIANRLSVNSSYLSRLFSQETGQSLTSYINNYRIEQAKTMMRSSNIKLYEIALKTGFSSSIVFSSTFKKVTGQTPTEYRNQNL